MELIETVTAGEPENKRNIKNRLCVVIFFTHLLSSVLVAIFETFVPISIYQLLFQQNNLFVEALHQSGSSKGSRRFLFLTLYYQQNPIAQYVFLGSSPPRSYRKTSEVQRTPVNLPLTRHSLSFQISGSFETPILWRRALAA